MEWAAWMNAAGGQQVAGTLPRRPTAGAALGFELPSRGIVQVSMNVEDPERGDLHEIVARVRDEAAARGVETAGSELVGLLPASAAA